MLLKYIVKKRLFFFFFILGILPAQAQQVPYNPISYRLFSPFILNPAIAGSKDFLSVDIIGGFTGKSHTQMVSTNTRIERKTTGFGPAGKTYSFTNFGVGGYFFNDLNTTDSIHNTGAGGTVSYHIPLNKKSLSFLSIGASFKGLYHFFEGNPDSGIPFGEYYFPNADLGIYLYSPSYSVGISAVNLLDSPTDTLAGFVYKVPAARQYNFIAAYKFVISRDLNLVIEPSVIIHTNDSLDFDLKESIEPALKIYAGSFCLGTYFNDYNKLSFLFQYRYPRFYVGTFFSIPRDSPFYKKSPTAEIAIGINFSRNRSGYIQNGHW